MSDRQCNKEGCTENCSTCSHKTAITKEELNQYSRIKHVIAVASGKGGVGKSTVTSLLARKLSSSGYTVGIMDADITGPSIPKMFGVSGILPATERGIEPLVSAEGIKIVSMNLILDDENSSVVLRGPMIAGIVKQFWTEVHWDDLDYLLIDMPPGTGDVPLTVYQSIPVDGTVIVTSPQNLVKMIVMKAYDMANKLNIPVLGIVENYSYFTCTDCGKKLHIFGESGIDELAQNMNTKVLAKIPIMSQIASAGDNGEAVAQEIDFDIDALIN